MTANRRPRSAPDDRELRLWKVGRALTITFVAAVLVAGGVFYSLVVLLDFQGIDRTTKLDAKTLFDLVKLSFGVVAGAGALVALVVAYRRQRVDEAGAHREATRLHTERFSQAVDKLGSASPAVRLGGVHALAGLADDAPDDSLRQTCIDVLCAYLRLPFPSDPGDLPNLLPDGTLPTEERRDAHQDKTDLYRALREVRHTVLRLIGDHYRIPQDTHRSWQGCDLDLTGVTIDGSIDFRGATFPGGVVSFGGATFSGGPVSFGGATFSGGVVSFGGATFSGGTVIFGGATFSGGEVSFGGATFSDGEVFFGGATFSGGRVSFGGATFSGGTVSFGDATFSRRAVYFDRVTFSGGRVYFDRATFSGGQVSFVGATFSGGEVSFVRVTFSGGRVPFERATFSGGEVSFERATFSDGEVSFGGATFSGGRVFFERATFSGGEMLFFHATFSGGMVDLGGATGTAPDGLLDAVGTPIPVTVTLPSGWLPSIP
ncbi:pentapeptide repeat-containing protein [Streptomyces avermitilis]|uniref:pentapeptide repeat-containing protein n=1 Tax=Streptomyces avermitilis TaxID=33903 RepID=UPI0033A31CA3